jgi:hypothetical protein
MKKIILSIIGLFLLCGCQKAITADNVISSFKEAKLPITNVVNLTAENDPNKLLGRPNQYIAKINWTDAQIATSGEPGLDTGGTLEVFNNADDMKARQEYIKAVIKGIAPFAEYSYGKGIFLLRLSHNLTPDQAKQYEDVFSKLLD